MNYPGPDQAILGPVTGGAPWPYDWSEAAIDSWLGPACIKTIDVQAYAEDNCGNGTYSPTVQITVQRVGCDVAGAEGRPTASSTLMSELDVPGGSAQVVVNGEAAFPRAGRSPLASPPAAGGEPGRGHPRGGARGRHLAFRPRGRAGSPAGEPEGDRGRGGPGGGRRGHLPASRPHGGAHRLLLPDRALARAGPLTGPPRSDYAGGGSLVSSASEEVTMAEFRYVEPFPLATDGHAVAPRRLRPRLGGAVRRPGDPEGRPRGADPPRARGHARRLVPLPARAPRAGRGHPRRPRGLRQRPRRGPRDAAERRGRRRVRPAPLPGHRHRHDRGQEGAAGLDRRAATRSTSSRGIFETYAKENLRYSQTVPLTMYEEKNSGTNLPAQIDLYADGRDGVPLPLRGQGRRLGQQDLPLPGDEGAAEPGEPGEVPRPRR